MFNKTKQPIGLALALSLLLAQPSWSSQQSEKKSNQVTKRAVGSAGKLQGHVLVYHLFCNDQGTRWSEQRRGNALQRLMQACSFITTQASRQQQQVSFAHEVGPPVDFEGRIPINHEADPIWTQQILDAVSKSSPAELVEQLKRKHRADHVAFCLHVDKNALSYNLASYAGVDGRFQAERAVCFTSYPDGRATATATYAHELLHLFGAGDLYFPYDKSEWRKQRARALFPNDIMYRADYNLNSLTIGAYTAYRIGWRDSLSSQFTVFDD
ncbi:MAG: hypothetical protein AAGF97_08280 [Planctomycetota bacterium]